MNQHDVLRVSRQQRRFNVKRAHYCTTTFPLILG